MTGLPEGLQNIAIPLLGICILLPLAVAAYLEPKKDFSRRVFLTMLYVCALVLAAEALQWLLAGRAGAGSVLALRLTLLFFYLLLAGLCFCWTIYSFYWFNGRRPGRKAVAGFAAGPCCAAAMLLVNLVTGSVYRVGADGQYARGGAFGLFIAFCYVYLMLSILVTALLALRRQRLQRRSVRMFLFFFLFPAAGPVAQYVLPRLALMGASEAVALLAVYVAFQQRTTAEYAAERAHFQDEMRGYERTLEQLLAASADALCVFRLNLTRNTYGGERGIPAEIAARCRGGTLDALLAAFADAAADAESGARFRALFDRAALLRRFAAGETRGTVEYRRLVDGENHLIRASLSMLRNPAGGDVEAIACSADIDRQDKEKKVIMAIADREYDYIALVDTTTGRLHYQYSPPRQPAPVRLRYGDYDEVMCEACTGMYAPSEADFAHIRLAAVTEALGRQEEYSWTFTCAAPDGAQLCKKISYRWLDETRCEILFFRSDLTAATQQERARAAELQTALREARRADAMKTEFLSNVSHDMRTPLNAVLGYTDLARAADDPARVREYLDKIGRAGNILLALVNDTLDLSKIGTGAVTLHPAPVRYGEVMEKVAAVIAPAAAEKGVRFAVDDSRAARVPVCLDALRLQEVLMNLLANAVRFTPENGQVTLAVECVELTDALVRDKVTVRDTGRGMQPEFVPRMFEPFAQEQQAADGSSGLGLAIVRRLVELMKGRIEVHSEPGRGTEIVLWLDFARPAAAPEPETAAPRDWPELAGRHILLCEDNAMNTEIARTILEQKGMTVTAAANGQAACRAFAESPPRAFDAVLMDIRMPVMDGHAAARRIRAMDRPDAASVPILAMSADAFDEDVAASLAAGMNGHLAKPLSAALLCEKLAQALAASGRTPE